MKSMYYTGMKEAMVVKIAYQCSDLYADAMKLMQLPSLKELWPRVRYYNNLSLVTCASRGFVYAEPRLC